MTPSFERFSAAKLIISALLCLIFLLWVLFFVGWRNDHLVIILLCMICYFGTAASRRFITAFSVFVFYWIVYDSMRVIPNYKVNAVEIIEPYQIEKSLFGIASGNNFITPNEYFAMYHHPVLDIIAGLFYINWVPVPLAFGVYLFLKDKIYFLRFAWAFVLTNLIGFVVYYLYPAAPPWYYELHGNVFIPDTPSNPAGLLRFDEITGTNIFKSIYSKSANVFAAIPSLHSAYPVIVLYYGLKKFGILINCIFVLFLFGIWFTAVYSGHHYIIDLLAGALCAVFSLTLFEISFRNQRIHRFFDRLSKRI